MNEYKDFIALHQHLPFSEQVRILLRDFPTTFSMAPVCEEKLKQVHLYEKVTNPPSKPTVSKLCIELTRDEMDLFVLGHDTDDWTKIADELLTKGFLITIHDQKFKKTFI